MAVERAPAGGRENLEARFARGLLRCQVALQEFSIPDARRLAVVIVAPSLSVATEQALERFVKAASRGVEWFVTDGQRLLGPGASGSGRGLRGGDRDSRFAARAPAAGGFSDRFLACVKALALSDDPAAGASAYSSSPAGSASDLERLAARAGVSLPHVYRFLRAYERMGFLERDRAGMRLVRRAALFEAWALRVTRQFERPLLGVVSSAVFDRWQRRAPAELAKVPCRLALGLHFAAAEHGAHEVAHAALTFYVDGDPAGVAEILGIDLIPRAARASAVEFVRPLFPEALWRGVLIGERGWPVTDAVQCYIDLLRHPARGAQAARALLGRHAALFADPEAQR